MNISIKCISIHFKGRGDVVSYNVCMWVYLVLIGFVITDSRELLMHNKSTLYCEFCITISQFLSCTAICQCHITFGFSIKRIVYLLRAHLWFLAIVRAHKYSDTYLTFTFGYYNKYLPRVSKELCIILNTPFAGSLPLNAF